MGAYAEKLYVRIIYTHTNHRIIKNWGWALTRVTMVLGGRVVSTNKCTCLCSSCRKIWGQPGEVGHIPQPQLCKRGRRRRAHVPDVPDHVPLPSQQTDALFGQAAHGRPPGAAEPTAGNCSQDQVEGQGKTGSEQAVQSHPGQSDSYHKWQTCWESRHRG